MSACSYWQAYQNHNLDNYKKHFFQIVAMPCPIELLGKYIATNTKQTNFLTPQHRRKLL